MTASTILHQVDNQGVATLTLNRPENHNAFDEQMIDDLACKLEGIAGDEDIRAVILSSRGRTFSAGADIGWMRRAAEFDEEENLADAGRLADMLYALYTLPQPTVALVQGPAYGGGIGLVAACDIALAVKSAQFSFTEVNLGLIPAVVSPYVIAAIGERQTRRLFLSGERFDAHVAYEIGLVHALVHDTGELQAACDRYVRGFVDAGQGALAAAKDLIAHVARRPIDRDVVDGTVRRIAAQRATDEAKARLTAFLDARDESGAALGRRRRTRD
jgi:methylglutaconyl-CoA hydratase